MADFLLRGISRLILVGSDYKAKGSSLVKSRSFAEQRNLDRWFRFAPTIGISIRWNSSSYSSNVPSSGGKDIGEIPTAVAFLILLPGIYISCFSTRKTPTETPWSKVNRHITVFARTYFLVKSCQSVKTFYFLLSKCKNFLHFDNSDPRGIEATLHWNNHWYFIDCHIKDIAGTFLNILHGTVNG